MAWVSEKVPANAGSGGTLADTELELNTGLSAPRAVALGRAVFAGLVFAAGAADLIAEGPLTLAGALYASWAFVLAIAPSRVLTARATAWATTLIDGIAVAGVVALARDTTALFFAAVTFGLFAAVARWSWRGALGAGFAVVALLAWNAMAPETNLQQMLAGLSSSPTEFAMPDLPLAPGAPLTTASLTGPSDAGPLIDNESLLRIGAVLLGALMLAYLAAAREGMRATATRLNAELRRTTARAEVAERRAERDRGRLARDVHDGILQDLTAANLLLRTASDAMPESARSQISEVSSLLAGQRRRLRALVDAVNAKSPGGTIRDEMTSLAASLAATWQCAVTAEVEPGDLAVPAQLRQEIPFFFSEATANAVRHGEATDVRLSVRGDGDVLVLVCTDNGIAAAAGGRPAAFVPFSLSERIAEIGGRLTAEGTALGARVRAELPLR